MTQPTIPASMSSLSAVADSPPESMAYVTVSTAPMPDPHRVPGAHWQSAQRIGQADHAGGQSGEEDQRRHEPGEVLGFAECGGPHGLHGPGDDQDDPCHGRCLRVDGKGGPVSRWW
jgi:hypothetical protein